MTLYCASAGDGVAWITGSSTGIGRQLALDLCAKGWTVAATARSPGPLEELVRSAAPLPGRVVSFACDVTDEEAMAGSVERIEAELGPVALAVFNAGTYSPTDGAALKVRDFVTMFEVNILGVVNGLVPVTERMRERGFGHVVLVGSVTAYFGLPTAAAYGASKAALNSMAQSLRYDFDKLNIRVQVVNPGFVDTPLTAKNRFSMPGLMKVEDASRRIALAIERGGFEVAFPRRLAWPLKLGSRLLPHSLYYRIICWRTGWNSRRFGLMPRKR